MMKQYVYEDDKKIMKECFIKLKTPCGKLLYPKAYMKVLDKQTDCVILNSLSLENIHTYIFPNKYSLL